MKKSAILLLLMASIHLNISAQWVTLDSRSTIQMNQIFFTNDTVGYMTDLNGDILKTIDGGQNWLGTTPLLGSILFLSADTGFGAASGIFKTVNGAASWNKITSINDGIFSFSFPGDGQIGYAAGINYSMDSLVIYKTNDRGNSWNRFATNFYYLPQWPVISFIDSSDGYLVDWYGGGVYETSNGAVSWNVQYIDTIGANEITSVHFPAKDTGFAVGWSGLILETIDGGQNWIPRQQVATNTVLNTVFFTSVKTGFAAGGDGISLGALIETIDGGQNWTLAINNSNTFYSIYFSSQNVGYACGANGEIMKYNAPTGIWESTYQNEISLYPNPSASGKFHFSMNSKDQTSKDISIYDMFGKQVYQNLKTDKSDLDFDISQNAKGVYLVKVVSEGKVSVSRVVFM